LHSICLLNYVTEGQIEGKIDVTGRRGRRRKKLLDDLKGTREYWKMKREALDRTGRRTRFGRVYGPVVRQTKEGRKERRRKEGRKYGRKESSLNACYTL